MMLWLLLLQVWASCLWLGHSEVVNPFASCPQYFYENTPPNNALLPQNPAWICQRYNNSYYYATLYDINRRIPVYSAYIYQPGPGTRRDEWMVEPQLIRNNLPKEMETEKTLSKNYNITSQQIGQNQAVNADYKNLTGLNRGHLNPNSHHNSNSSKYATFTLTNIVPQNSNLNGGAWNDYEQNTMANESKGCISNTTYVIVGVVPGNTSIANGRVNVPSHIWSSACCRMTSNKTKAWAAIVENKAKNITLLTLGKLEDQLTNLYGKGKVSLFHSACPRT
ncbi:endonuclease domain-containing 1 protein-like [Pipra filicauda]|uniref:Endonuclease domain-containing 1 protein-like n=1 Tax=Pipra filicauda TaxID=649802 RepID=A0A7R5KQX4_9PASS|nr:endonuclease domain-containing 1 protein-like [Pipra filicauda]